MKAEKRVLNPNNQFSIVMNPSIREQLEYVATRQHKTKAKLIKDLINQTYLDLVTSER